MWGRLSSMAQAVQEKLEESLGEDQGEDLEASAGSSPQSKVEIHSFDWGVFSLVVKFLFIRDSLFFFQGWANSRA